jgi:hypothetical protein
MASGDQSTRAARWKMRGRSDNEQILVWRMNSGGGGGVGWFADPLRWSNVPWIG